jgi:hypothetical protein
MWSYEKNVEQIKLRWKVTFVWLKLIIDITALKAASRMMGIYTGLRIR